MPVIHKQKRGKTFVGHPREVSGYKAEENQVSRTSVSKNENR